MMPEIGRFIQDDPHPGSLMKQITAQSLLIGAAAGVFSLISFILVICGVIGSRVDQKKIVLSKESISFPKSLWGRKNYHIDFKNIACDIFAIFFSFFKSSFL